MTNALAFPKKFKKNCKKNPKKKREKRKKKKEHVILASFLAKPSWAGPEWEEKEIFVLGTVSA